MIASELPRICHCCLGSADKLLEMTSNKELLLQRILDDDSDSDSRQGQSIHMPQQQNVGKKQPLSANLKPVSRLSNITVDTDIERILRETDEDDESSREFNISSLSPIPHFAMDNESSECSSSNSSLQHFEVIRNPNSPQKSTLSSLTASAHLVASKSQYQPKSTPERSRSAEEWTLLQKILGEHEDDDLSQEANLDSKLDKRYSTGPKISSSLSNVASSNHTPPLWKSSSSFLTDVNAILENLHLEDDDDDDESDAAAIAELDDLASRFQSIHASSKARPNESPHFKTKIDSFLDSSLSSAFMDDVKQRVSSMPISQLAPVTSVQVDAMTLSSMDRDIYTKPTMNQSVSYNHKTATSSTLLDTMNPLCDTISSAAIKYAESYEARLLRPSPRDIISPLMVKRRMKPKIEIPTKSRLSKMGSVIHNPTHPRFNFAGVIDSKAFPKISSTLLRNSQDVKREMGLPTALAVNSKFIAIGTQEGYALVFDHFEELRQKLGLSAVGTNIVDEDVSVTSLDLSSNGETLIAGYSNGSIILWDIIKGSVMKSVTDLHPSPITVCRFVSDQFMNVVTVDAGGLVNRVIFSKTIWSSVGIESECLLDGSAGQILAMHILPSFNSLKGTASYEGAKGVINHPSHRKLVLMALTSDRSSFAVAIEPKIHVLHRWPRPTSETVGLNKDESNEIDAQSNISALPCLSWGWVLISGGENIVTPILARSWGRSLQFLRAIFPPIEEANRNNTDDNNHWPAFGIHDEFEASDPVVALEWLGDRSMVYLTITNEFTVMDSVMMTLTERLDFSGIKLVYAEFALSRSAVHNEKSATGSHMSTTFLNSVRSNEERILILCREELLAVSILDIHKRVQSLEEDGEWLEALALALDHYESSVKSQEDRKRDPEGKRDLSNHPEFLPRLRLSEDEEWLADLLRRYLYLAVDNAPESTSEPMNASTRNRVTSVRQGLLNTHFQMLAGVCIEFCVVSRRLDLLYGEIFDKFQKSGNSSIFFEVVEPYIMNDKLKYVTAEVMAQFVNHCKMNNDLSTFERCLIHLDVSIMDFDSCVALLRQNSMHSALIHVYTAGLDDFITPLQVLFEDVFDNCELFHTSSMRRSDGAPTNLFHQFGYKSILYIRNCLHGRTFPRGDPLKPDDRLETLRPQLLSFIIQSQYTPISSSRTLSKNLKDNLVPLRESKYPYLRALILLDPKAVFDTFSMVFDNPAVRFMKSLDILDTIDDWNRPGHKYEEQSQDKTLCPDRQETARILSLIMNDLTLSDSLAPAPFALDYFYDFLAKYLIEGVIRTPKPITTNIFSRLCTKAFHSEHTSDRKETEETVIHLLQILPLSTFDIDDILRVFEQAKFTRAALFLHKTGVHHMSHGSLHHFMSVIDCYLQEEDPYFRREVFTYIKEECSKDSALALSKSTTNRDNLRVPLLSKFPDLVKLDAVQAARLVSDIYADDLEMVLQSLDHDEGLLLYKFLETIINGELTKRDPYAGPLLLSSLSIRNYQRYLELMAKYHPELVYRYLQTHDNYRLDECLKLCQSYDIPDASAYLLERLGNVSSALQLLLQTLEGRLMILKRKVRGLNLHSHSIGRVSPQAYIIRLHLNEAGALVDVVTTREFQSTKMILDATLDLCERNSKPSGPSTGNGSQLWLNVVDRLLNAKGFLRLQKEKPEHSQTLLHVVTALLHTSLQRMIKRVPLSDLIQMITIEHATHRLGDLREMISVMLQVYGSEAHIYSDALSVIQNDAHTMTLLKQNLKQRATKAFACTDRIVNVTGGSIPDYKSLSQILLNINYEGDASLVKGNNTPLETVETGFKGRQAKPKTKNFSCLASFGRNIKTKTDELFSMGLSSETACIARHYGMMGDPDHFGRLA